MPELLTIGYTEKSAKERIDTFLAQPKTILADIRFSPRSQWYHLFNKSRLEERYGEQYWHIPVLGNLNYREADREKGIKIADAPAGIARIKEFFEHGYSVMLLCACKNYEQCHRKVVYDLIMAELAKAIPAAISRHANNTSAKSCQLDNAFRRAASHTSSRTCAALQQNYMPR